MARFRSRYSVGDVVEVLPIEEILATLDKNGELENMPFMPEMVRHCGRTFRVAASAHKTCDTINKTGCRRMHRAVHLEGLRCDGASHGGCQNSCRFFWKEAWLQPASSSRSSGKTTNQNQNPISLQTLEDKTTRDSGESNEVFYVCQATRLFDATKPLRPSSVRQYVADVRSKNFQFGEATKILSLGVIHSWLRSGHLYRLAVRAYEIAHRLIRGGPSPFRPGRGKIPVGEPTPAQQLNLNVGEVVRVKPHHEILATLNELGRNRGMLYDKEMVRYCGQEFEVCGRISKVIDESSGRLLTMATPAVALKGTYCTSQYSERRLMCPRKIVPFWRENWLERVESETAEK